MKVRKTAWVIWSALSLVACGGGGGGGGGGGSGSPHSAGTATQPPAPTTGTQRLPSDSVRMLDQAQVVDAAALGLTDDTFAPSSIVLHGDVLYVANDVGTSSSILRYDLRARQILAPLAGVPNGNSTDGFNHLDDLARYGNRLYTASMSSNRVDVFDISNSANPTYVTTLGTGSWSSASNVGLTHALAVAANSQYVFAVDTHQRISIWDQSDVTQANSRKAVKHAYLSLPDCGNIYCDVKLTATENRLLATMGNGKSYSYDVGNLAASTNLIPATVVENSVTNAIAEGDDGYLYVSLTGGGVDRFTAASLPTQGSKVLPSLAVDMYRQVEQPGVPSAAMVKAQDISFDQQRLAMLQGKKYW